MPQQPNHITNQSLRSPCSNGAGAYTAHSKHSSAAASLDTAVEIQVHSNDQGNSISKDTRRKSLHAFTHFHFKWISLADFQRFLK